MQSEKNLKLWRLRPFYLWLLAGTVAMLLAGWGWMQWRVWRLENAVWDRADVSEIESDLWWLEKASENRVVPEELRGRLSGLLGDWYFKTDGAEAAEVYYERLRDRIKMGETLNLAERATASLKKGSDLSDGYQHYVASANPLSLSDDSEMAYQFPLVLPGENARRQMEFFQRVAEEDRDELRDGIRADFDVDEHVEGAERLVAKYEGLLNDLKQLSGPFAPKEAGEYELLGEINHWARLLLLDARVAAVKGDFKRKESSFAAAYQLIDYFAENRTIAVLLLELSHRVEVLDSMTTDQGVGRDFVPLSVIDADAVDEALRADYQSRKELLLLALADSTLEERRFRRVVLNKYFDYFKRIREEPERVREIANFSDYLAEWMFRNRKYYYRHGSRSFAEGEAMAEAVEDLSAEVVAQTGIPILGRIEDSVIDIRRRELERIQSTGNRSAE